MRGKTATPILLLSMLLGCFYHSARIELTPTQGTSAHLSAAEIDRATEIVAEVVASRGFVRSSSGVERLSREENEWDEFILVAYWAGPESSTKNRVVVSVLLDKESGLFSVLVRDLDSPASSNFTNSLVQSLEQTLKTKFPSHKIRVERSTVGPAFGP